MVKLTWPGYKYHGPGNPTENGEPVNEVDHIAQIHDNDYERAGKKEDIWDSDKKASKEFWRVGGLAGTTGAIALKVKNLVEEKLLNTSLYPSSFSGKLCLLLLGLGNIILLIWIKNANLI